MNRNNLSNKAQLGISLAVAAIVGLASYVFAPPSLPTASNTGISLDTNGVLAGRDTNFFVLNSNAMERGRSTLPTNNLRTELLSLLAARVSPSLSNSVAVMDKTNGLVWSQSGYVTTIADARTLGNILSYNSTSGVLIVTPSLLAASATFSGTVTAAGFTSAGTSNFMKFTDTNATPNVAGFVADNNMSDSVLQAIGLRYFASGGTNDVQVDRWGDFVMTNNLGTNMTLFLTNGAVGKRFFIRILGPTNGNSYTLTLLSANSWLMNWDLNSLTNGGTGSTITVSNNQSLEIDGVFTKTPTNPLIDLVYARRRL